MTDKEFRNLRRSDLIEIIYEYQKREKNLSDEIKELRQQLAEKENLENIASISEAVTTLSQIIESAKRSADGYLEKVNAASQSVKSDIRHQTEKVCDNEQCIIRQKRKNYDKSCKNKKGNLSAFSR